MWFLYAIQNGQETTRTLLRPGLTYSLGRKETDILLPLDDKSVSRKHATLEIEQIILQHLDEIDWQPHVLLKDLGSKFGSYVNSVRLEGVSLEQGAYMKDGDTLHIGRTGVFRLSWKPLTICRQSMPQPEKQKLLDAARTIGAKVTHKIRSPYTHLLMSTIKISVKVAHCVAEGKPIVSQSWLDTLVDLPDQDYTFPSVSDYLPPIDTSCNGPFGVPDFAPNPERRRLFTGKRFVFFDQKQYEQLSSVVKHCNGDGVLCNVDKTDPFDEQFGNGATIVVQSASVHETQGWKNIVNALDSLKTRTITESEICWAIFYNSIEVQCNTTYDAASSIANPHNDAPALGTDNPSSSSSSATPALPPNAHVLPSSSTTLPPSTTVQNEIPQDHRTPDQAPSKPNEEMTNIDLDLDDFFDQIVGDEPSRPAPTTNASPEPSISRVPPQTTTDNEIPDYQNSSSSNGNNNGNNDNNNNSSSNNSNISNNNDGSNSSSSNINSNILSSDGVGIDEQHDTTKKSINKGKRRMYEPDTPINEDGMLNDDVESSSTGRKSKKPRTGKNTNSTVPPPRKPFVLPELENENVDITAGKIYTKVVYSALVIAPSPPDNWTAGQQQQRTSDGLNYKKFKKVNQQRPSSNPILTVDTLSRFASSTVEVGPLPESDEDDFSEIRIKSNAKRGSMRI